MALNGLYCADMPLSNYSLTYWLCWDMISVLLPVVWVKREWEKELY